jgi:hypothetical protein
MLSAGLRSLPGWTDSGLHCGVQCTRGVGRVPTGTSGSGGMTRTRRVTSAHRGACSTRMSGGRGQSTKVVSVRLEVGCEPKRSALFRKKERVSWSVGDQAFLAKTIGW